MNEQKPDYSIIAYVSSLTLATAYLESLHYKNKKAVSNLQNLMVGKKKENLK